MAKKLYLLDGMALVYRAHFAFMRNPIKTSTGVNVSALFGFINTLIELRQSQEPTHLAVVFDTQAPTQRHVEFPAYKAQREAMPEELSVAIPNVKRFIEAFDIPVLELDGYEADDIIGTLAKRAVAEVADCEVYMVTPDKDFAQLVEDRIAIFKPGRGGGDAEILRVADILANWQIERPEQVIDILGLWGDASDNIPGIPGIGEKTAKKLIAEFGSIENLVANAAALKGKQKENVEQFAEQGLLSKRLATIILDVPVPLDWAKLELGHPHEDALKALLVEFEFNGLGKRIFGDDFKAGRGAGGGELASAEDGGAKLRTIVDVPHDYRIVKTKAERAKLIAEMSALKAFCFDTETSDLDVTRAQVIGLALSWKKGQGYYVPLPDRRDEGVAILREFQPLFENEAVEKIGHNLKFDLAVLLWNGIAVQGPFFDTMLAHALVEPDQRHGMDYLSETYLGYTPVSIKTLLGEGAKKKKKDPDQLMMLDMTMQEVARERLDEVAEYAAEDADVTFQLSEILRGLLEERGQHRVFYDIEAPLLPVLVAMEHEGIALDKAALAEIGGKLESSIRELEKSIQEKAGQPFNLNSPKQLGEILFDKLKLDEKPKKTKTGQYKTDEQVLTALAPKHPLVQEILDYREATKLKGTYVDALPGFLNPKSRRIHSSFQQLVTATGRLNSNNPNLQNIPVRSELGREVRKAFVPRGPEWLLLSADYSQVELRVMAALSGDAAMVEAFQQGIDIHSATAARVNGVTLDAVEPEMRRTAKMVNFGIIFGISAFGLSQRLGIGRSEAKEIIDEYFRQYPGVQAYMEKTIEDAKVAGYVETITGRRRFLPDITSGNATVRGAAERTAINTPIQGTAADMIKIAMARVAGALDEGGFRTRMILQVHDELVFDLVPEEAEKVTPLIVACMRDAIPLSVPVVVDTGTGQNWLEAH